MSNLKQSGNALKPSCKSKKECYSTEKSTNGSDKPIPRRCVAIRRTCPKEGIEKTELRFVVYRDPTKSFDQHAFLDEVNDFLREQAEMRPRSGDDDIQGGKRKKTKTNRQVATNGRGDVNDEIPSSRQDSDAEESTNKVKEVKAPIADNKIRSRLYSQIGNGNSVVNVPSKRHDKTCKRAETLRQSAPLIKDLIEYFRKMEARYNRKDIEAMRLTAENVLRETECVLKEGGPIDKGLLYKIQGLNKLAESVASIHSSSSRYSSACVSTSNVNAYSDDFDSSSCVTTTVHRSCQYSQ